MLIIQRGSSNKTTKMFLHSKMWLIEIHVVILAPSKLFFRHCIFDSVKDNILTNETNFISQLCN